MLRVSHVPQGLLVDALKGSVVDIIVRVSLLLLFILVCPFPFVLFLNFEIRRCSHFSGHTDSMYVCKNQGLKHYSEYSTHRWPY